MSAGIDTSLRRVHRSVLATLGACAVWIVLQTAGDVGEPEPDRAFTTAAVALGVGAILARRIATAPGVPVRVRFALVLASLLLACGLGVSGAALAHATGAQQAPLLYVLGGAILSLQPPPRFETTADDPGGG